MIIEDGKMVKGIIPKATLKEGKVYYKDIDGKVSEGFVSGTVYAGGFALVKTAPNKSYKFRDMLGNITVNKTQKGKDFFDFWMGKLKIEDLKTEYFADDRFYDLTKKIARARAKSDGYYSVLCDVKRHEAHNMLEEKELN